MSRIGRYEVESEIGRGAMGVVYLARDPRLNRRVAVKTHALPDGLSEEQREEFRERFVREAHAAAALSHPGIVTVYDADEDAERGLPFIAMELVEGQSLRELLDEQGRMEPERAVTMACAVAEALQAAHDAGIVHRDIKPANLLIREPDGAVKVTDFGVARVMTSELTQVGTSLGTPAYMSPEQIEGRPVDSRSDLFSLGVILYEVLCGERPFTGDNVPAVIHSVTQETPLPISKRVEGLPRALDRFFDGALAKDCSARFASGRAFKQALESALADDADVDVSATVVGAEIPAETVIAIPDPLDSSDWSVPSYTAAAPVLDREESSRWRSRKVLIGSALALLLLGAWVLIGGRGGAYLQLDAKSSVESGELTLLVDGEEVYSRDLNAPPQHKAFIKKILDQKPETFEAWIKIGPGKHEVTASIVAEGASGPYSDTVVVDMERGQTRKLKLTAGRPVGRALSLKVN